MTPKMEAPAAVPVRLVPCFVPDENRPPLPGDRALEAAEGVIARIQQCTVTVVICAACASMVDWQCLRT